MTRSLLRDPLRVCFPFAGGQFGGSHISALKLLRNLDRRRVEPVIVLRETDGPLAAFLKEQDQPFIGFDAGETLTPGRRGPAGVVPYLCRTLPRMRRFIRDGRFDIVHTNDARTHVNWGIAARLAGAGLVWHHRGDPDAIAANWLAPLIADRMITVSRFAVPSRAGGLLKGRASVVYSPFEEPAAIPDRAGSKAEFLAAHGISPDVRVISFVGNLVERKRPILFLDIIARLRERHPEIPVLGCMFGVVPKGRPDLEPSIRAKAEALGLAGHVLLMGFRQPIEPYLAASDVLLVPAIGEPFGRTLIEAMFLGTPVVATRHGGNIEAIEHGRTGFLVEPESAEAFVEPTARLLTDQALWTSISGQAARHAGTSFSVERHVEQVMAVYEAVLRRSSRPARTPLTEAHGEVQ